VAWLAAGDRLPVFTDSLDLLMPPRWPSWRSVALPWTLAGVSMVVGAVAAAWALRRTRGPEREGDLTWPGWR
jgi:hypothetical protein